MIDLNKASVSVLLICHMTMSAGCRGFDSSSSKKIVGGEPTEKSRDQRALASTVRLEYIGTSPYNPGGRCTGTLVGPGHIVTAAHCLRLYSLPDLYLSTGQPKIAAMRSTIHPQWGKVANYAYDIGVISFKIVDDPATGDAIGLTPTRIANPENLKEGSDLLLAGYGDLAGGESALSQLYQVTTKVASIDTGMKTFDIESGTGKGPCHGDSGGPAYLDDNGVLLLVGATSHNAKGACDGGAGTYTDVTRFQGWIKCAFAEQQLPLDGLADDASTVDCANFAPTPP